MFVVDNESVKLEPLSRDDVLRGIILLVSVFLIFFGFSSDDRATGIFSLLISTLFLFYFLLGVQFQLNPIIFLKDMQITLAFILIKQRIIFVNLLTLKKNLKKF